MNNNKGKIIVIEGVDSSGKETQTKLLKQKLIDKGIKTMLVSFPRYKTPTGDLVKSYLSGLLGDNPRKINPYIASAIYAIDRYSSKINDSWMDFYNKGGYVIFDRYVLSNIIHQGTLMDFNNRNEYIKWLYDFEYNKGGLPIPDRIIFLDMLPRLAQLLMKDRYNKATGKVEKDIIEKYFSLLQNSYLESINIAKEQNWIIQTCYKEKNIFNLENIKKPKEINNEIYEKIKDIL